jgi:hypothetical protein
MPDLIRHPEKPESTWIVAESYTSCPAFAQMTIQKKAIIIDLRYL